jgi:hypothetical protein
MTGMLSEEHQKWLEARGLDLEIVTRYGLFTDRQSQGGRDLVIETARSLATSTAGHRKSSGRIQVLRARSGTRMYFAM